MKSKFLATVTLALTLAIGASAVAPKNADAAIILSSIVFGPEMGVPMVEYTIDDAVHGDPGSILITAGCVILLPLCLLDEKTNAKSTAISSADLLANGYSAEDIQQIQSDQAVLLENMKTAHVKLVIKKTDTRESIQSDIHTLYPGASAVYMDFFTNSLNLK